MAIDPRQDDGVNGWSRSPVTEGGTWAERKMPGALKGQCLFNGGHNEGDKLLTSERRADEQERMLSMMNGRRALD